MIGRNARCLAHQGVRIYEERWLAWEAWNFDGVVLVGAELFAQLVWQLQVKPTLLESDSGPLDARVP